jgi:hypothetical protein
VGTKLISPLAPRSTCVLVATASVNGSEITDQGGMVWFGLAAGHNSAACATFFGAASATAGRKLWHAVTSACLSTEMVGPFFSPSGVYVRLAGTGASALVAKDTER